MNLSEPARVVWGEDVPFEVPHQPLWRFLSERSPVPKWEGRTGESPKVFICHSAKNTVETHLASDLAREQGGFLVGSPYADLANREVYVDISAAIPAIGAFGTAGHWKLTREALAYASRILETRYAEKMVVGWYHSHPGLGAFFSGTDHHTQRMFYPNAWNVALVCDPRPATRASAERGRGEGVTSSVAWFIGARADPLLTVREYSRCHRAGSQIRA